jgi:hypothetical protein
VPDTIEASATPPSKGLLARAFGVIFSPRATYADIAAHPRVLGALLAIIVIIGATNFVFLSTAVGQRALVDRQLSTMESFGMTVSDQALANMERRAPQSAYFSLAGVAVFVPVVFAIIAGLALVVFNAVLGGDASFKQAYAIVTHAGFIGALQVLFVTPLNYARESMSSATSLAVFLPMVDDTSFPGMALGSIDFFRLWSTITLAIGFAVLYKRRTSPIAWSLLAVYVIIVLIVSAVRAAVSGA